MSCVRHIWLSGGNLTLFRAGRGGTAREEDAPSVGGDVLTAAVTAAVMAAAVAVILEAEVVAAAAVILEAVAVAVAVAVAAVAIAAVAAVAVSAAVAVAVAADSTDVPDEADLLLLKAARLGGTGWAWRRCVIPGT